MVFVAHPLYPSVETLVSQAMLIGHGNTAYDTANDTNKALIGTVDK